MRVDLLALLQAIAISAGDPIVPQAHALADALLLALGDDDRLVADVLPAIGAVARALGGGFAEYLRAIVDRVIAWIAAEELARPAAGFVSDVVCAMPGLDEELLGRFVAALLAQVACDAFDARVAIFGALADIARSAGGACAKWEDKFLAALEAEAKTALAEDADSAEAKAFAAVCLQGYQAVVPVLAGMKGGDRKVRGFFHVVEHILKLDVIDDALLSDCVLLVRGIAETFQRKMSVFLNKPAVIELLRLALESENDTLKELAQATFHIVKSF
jgi:hypothetical protein